MKTYRIPRTDLEVSRLAFGCDRLVRDGVPADALGMEDIARAERLINIAYEKGITLFDTAAVYGRGSSEAALGRVLAQTPGLRHKIVIQTKCVTGHSSDSIVASVEGSLKRIDTDRLDILLLHVQDPLLEPQEVAEAFDDLRRSGKVRHFGVSNHTITRIELLKKAIRQPLVVHQLQLSLAHPDPLDEAYFNGEGFRLAGPYTGVAGLDYCRLNDMHVQAYSPLRGKSVVGPVALLAPLADVAPELRGAIKTLHEMAALKGTTPAALGLAWLLRHPGRIQPIIGAKRAEHIVDCSSADNVEISSEEWRKLFRAALNLT